MGKSIIWMILKKAIGFIIFLICWVIANILNVIIQNSIFSDLILILNQNINVIILLGILFLLGDIFSTITFPWNVPAPLFYAIGAIFLIRFLLSVLVFVDTIVGEDIFSLFFGYSSLIYSITFVVVLVAGLIDILKKESK